MSRSASSAPSAPPGPFPFVLRRGGAAISAMAALLGAGAGGAVRYAVMVLFAGAVWPMTFAPLCHALEKRVY